MPRLRVATALAATALAVAGCLIEPIGTLTDQSAPNPPPAPPDPEPAGAPDAAVEADFPCDVRAVLETYCADCHAGDRYIVPFNRREIWLSPYGDAGTFGDRAAQMVMTEMMPPIYSAGKLPTADERAVLLDWVAAGMPAGACGPLTPPERP